MPLQHVSKFVVNQNGVFVSRTMFNYMYGDGQIHQSAQTDNQTIGQTCKVDPGDLFVPDGSTVWLYQWVMASIIDPVASKAFVYDKASPNIAYYTCSGITNMAQLTLDKVGTS